MDSQVIKAWDSNQKIYVSFNSIEEYFQYLMKNKKSFNFSLKNKFSPKDKSSNTIEDFHAERNQTVIYTDHDHPITVQKIKNYTYVDRDFFIAHKKEFIDLFKQYLNNIDRKKASIIHIYDYAITDDELFNLINDPDLKDTKFVYYCIEGKKLSPEQLKIIKERHLNFTIKENGNETIISTNKAINNHTYSELPNIKKISLKIPDDINIEEIDNYVYIGGIENNAEITFNFISRKRDIAEYNAFSKVESTREEDYYKIIIQIIKKLGTHNKEYNIIISVNNREKLRQSGLLDSLPKNINIIINNDAYKYSLEEFMLEEKKLQKLLEPIKKENLSPFERYIAAYNLAKQFKKYKENEDNLDESRYLRYILDEQNEYIVCVGFSKLLAEFLDYLEIPNVSQGVAADISYDNGFTMEEKKIQNVPHARCIVKIDDDKYNIHGIYVADPTWDNDLENDDYLNALMTFDRKKEARRLEKLSDEDLLLDFHSWDEFSKKVTYYLERRIKDLAKKEKSNHSRNIYLAYKEYYYKILTILYFFDYQKYNYFQQKYSLIGTVDKKIIIDEKELYKNSNQQKLDELFNAMLQEYYEYIITITNKEISIKTVLEAAAIVKSQVNGYSREEIEEWLRSTITHMQEREKKAFPYEYDSSNPTEAYLEDREEFGPISM